MVVVLSSLLFGWTSIVVVDGCEVTSEVQSKTRTEKAWFLIIIFFLFFFTVLSWCVDVAITWIYIRTRHFFKYIYWIVTFFKPKWITWYRINTDKINFFPFLPFFLAFKFFFVPPTDQTCSTFLTSYLCSSSSL